MCALLPTHIHVVSPWNRLPNSRRACDYLPVCSWWGHASGCGSSAIFWDRLGAKDWRWRVRFLADTYSSTHCIRWVDVLAPTLSEQCASAKSIHVVNLNMTTAGLLTKAIRRLLGSICAADVVTSCDGIPIENPVEARGLGFNGVQLHGDSFRRARDSFRGTVRPHPFR